MYYIIRSHIISLKHYFHYTDRVYGYRCVSYYLSYYLSYSLQITLIGSCASCETLLDGKRVRTCITKVPNKSKITVQKAPK